MERSENIDRSFRWFVVLVHGIVSECDEEGWYARFVIVSVNLQDAEQILEEYGRFIGLEKISVDEWNQEEPASSREKYGIRQNGGRIYYGPGDPEQKELSYATMSWWYHSYTKAARAFQFWRFNRRIRSRVD